jgi:hypothetical protein
VQSECWSRDSGLSQVLSECAAGNSNQGEGEEKECDYRKRLIKRIRGNESDQIGTRLVAGLLINGVNKTSLESAECFARFYDSVSFKLACVLSRGAFLSYIFASGWHSFATALRESRTFTGPVFCAVTYPLVVVALPIGCLAGYTLLDT